MIKFLCEAGPIICFFVGYKLGGIMEATLYMLCASLISIAITYLTIGSINKVNLISTALLLASGSLTLFSGNSIFIKMKPTILYSLFAISFLISNFKRRPIIQLLLGKSFKLKSETAWLTINYRFMIFFALMAISNELVWRFYNEEIWVNYKVFAVLPMTIIFTFSQIPFLLRNSEDSKN